MAYVYYPSNEYIPQILNVTLYHGKCSEIFLCSYEWSNIQAKGAFYSSEETAFHFIMDIGKAPTKVSVGLSAKRIFRLKYNILLELG